MIKKVLFLQGAGDGAYEADAKLVGSLRSNLGPEYEVCYPAVPNDGDTDYVNWRDLVLRRLASMGDDAILVGHSVGASVLIKVLIDSRPADSITGVFLVAAPFWHQHKVWRWHEAALPENASDRLSPNLPLFLYQGDADEIVPVEHVEMYARAFPQAVVRRLKGRDHQLNDDLTEVARDIREATGT